MSSRLTVLLVTVLTLCWASCSKRPGTVVCYEPPCKAPPTLEGVITTNRTLDSSKVWLLKGIVYVSEGVTLTIPKGTVLYGDKLSKSTLVICKRAKLIAEGTSSEPIVFTSSREPGARREGDWGGIILLGKAPVNTPDANISSMLAGSVHLNLAHNLDYGGTDANDNSGSLRFVRIEFAGVTFGIDNELNGLTLAGVGAGTRISHVQVYRSGDDAFEWLGGTVNADHLIAAYSWDDDFSVERGFSGTVQFALAHRARNIADQSGSSSIECSNDTAGSARTPQTNPLFSNFTVVGPSTSRAGLGPYINADYRNGLHALGNAAPRVINSIITGFPVGVFIDDQNGTTSDDAEAGRLQFRNNIIAGTTNTFKASPSWANAQTWFTATSTRHFDSSGSIALQAPFLYPAFVYNSDHGRPDFRLQTQSPAAVGADFTGFPMLETVDYLGAFNFSDDWTAGWTTWEAENTHYPSAYE